MVVLTSGHASRLLRVVKSVRREAGGPSSKLEKLDPQTGSHLTLELPSEGLANLSGERITNGVLQVPIH